MRNARAVLFEAALVAALGLIVALLANMLSPLGLRLGRNYFPGDGPARGSESRSPALPATPTNPPAGAAAANSSNALAAVVQRLRQHGLQPMTSNEVVELVGDPRYGQGLLVLIDDRDDSHYQAGHIPGAWQFDHYHAEQYLPTVLPVCLNAQKVVVYCTGGECEDSEFAAITLGDAGVPRDRLFVYPGGISEWTASGQPVETGARQSGQLAKPKL